MFSVFSVNRLYKTQHLSEVKGNIISAISQMNVKMNYSRVNFMDSI